MTIPALLTQQSGSVGETVFSRNQHGPYTRDRTLPADPATLLQVAVRAALSECVTAWKTTLTETERRGWDTYALAVRTRTALGRSTNAGGLAMYIRANVPRIQAAVGATPRVDQAPTLLTSADMDPITRVVLNIIDDTLHAFVPRSQDWLNQPGGAVLFYASRPQPLTVNFWAGPYVYAAKLIGQPLGPPHFPFSFPAPFPAGPNERVFIRLRQTRADARLGPSVRLTADHLPQSPPVPVAAVKSGGFNPIITVTFDTELEDTFLDTANWTVRWNDRLRTVNTAVILGFTPLEVRLLTGLSVFSPGPDTVSFAPPPFDVVGLLTGLPVEPFTAFPIT